MMATDIAVAAIVTLVVAGFVWHGIVIDDLKERVANLEEFRDGGDE